MEKHGTSNDNKVLDHGVLDPDRHYIDHYMAVACAHFKELGFDRNTIASAMLDELFKMLDGNPFRTGADEGAVKADMQFLYGMEHRIAPMSEQWVKGYVRLQKEKRPSFRFDRAAKGPAPTPLPRTIAAPPNYDPAQHKLDLILLKMRHGHVYTQKEVMTRYHSKMERVKERPYLENGYDRKQGLDEARNRLLNWIRTTTPVTDSASA